MGYSSVSHSALILWFIVRQVEDILFNVATKCVSFSLCGNAITLLCRHQESCRRPWPPGLSVCRSQFWQGCAERGGGGTHGAQCWNYLHNCSVKAILKEGGNKELSVWAAPFGQIEILSAATAPPPPPPELLPSCLFGWLWKWHWVGTSITSHRSAGFNVFFNSFNGWIIPYMERKTLRNK